jgi:hypothetical protein
VENRNLGRQISGLDKIRVLQTAFLAKANRADVAATVTLDAPLEFIDPAPKAFLLITAFKVFRVRLIIDTDPLFIGSGFGRF